jgi:hypothetical protein
MEQQECHKALQILSFSSREEVLNNTTTYSMTIWVIVISK